MMHPGESLSTGKRKSDDAYEILRDRIVRLTLAPLAVLSEKALSDELGIGIQPIREALRRLEFDGLVTIFPRRGTFVAEVGLRDERHIAEIRIETEGLCAELAASRASEAECDELLRIAEGYSSWPVAEGVDGDESFHRTMYAMTHNRFLEASMNRYYNLSARAWHYSASRPTQHTIPVENDHLETALAIRERDGERAREAARRHIMNTSNKLRMLLEADDTLSSLHR